MSSAGSQQKSGSQSVAVRRTGHDVSADDVTADAVSGADGGGGDRSPAAHHVRHHEKLSAHARTADGGQRGGHTGHSGRLFASHRLPGRPPRLQRVGKSADYGVVR